MVNDYQFPTLYFGVANVVANGLIMLRYVFVNLLANTADMFYSSVVLWVSQNMEDDYTYNLSL